VLPPTIAVLGLGLIGGSLARDLAAAGARVLGHDADDATLAAAREAGVVAEALDDELEGLEAAEVAVLAVPVAAAPALLARAAPRLAGARLVTDVGSTKRAIVAAAAETGLADRFVGGHPLAGDHRSGWSATRTGLFRGMPVYLCPSPASSPAAVARAVELWCAVGAVPETVDAESHDRRVAWTSHLPQAASSALARALAAAGVPRAGLGPGGRDVTRLAAGSAAMWCGIALENAAELDRALAALGAEVDRLRAALRAGDRDAVHAWFADGRRWTEPPGA
jgi:prephenate dehydrogenase